MLIHGEDTQASKILDNSALTDQSPDIRSYAAEKYWDDRYAAQEAVGTLTCRRVWLLMGLRMYGTWI